MSLYLWNRDEFSKMHDILETSFRNELWNPDTRKVLLSPLNFFYHSTVIMSRTFIALPVVFCIGPLLEIIAQCAKGVHPITYHLPYLAKFPWDSYSSMTVYVIHYIFEFFSGMGVGFISVSIDSAFGFYVFQIGAQFRVLSYRLENLKATDDYHALIKECVLRHRTLNQCREFLERVYGPIVLFFMITSAISLCANVYQITKVPFSSLIFRDYISSWNLPVTTASCYDPGKFAFANNSSWVFLICSLITKKFIKLDEKCRFSGLGQNDSMRP